MAATARNGIMDFFLVVEPLDASELESLRVNDGSSPWMNGTSRDPSLLEEAMINEFFAERMLFMDQLDNFSRFKELSPK